MAKLTKSQIRLLQQAKRGPKHVHIGTGNNGATRKMLRRLHDAGLMVGHVITDAGRDALASVGK